MARACLLPERAEEAGLDCTVQRCHAHHRTATDTDCLHNSSSSQLSVSKRQLRQKRNLPPCPNKSNDDRVQQSFHSNLLCCLAEGSALFRSINFAPNNGRVIRLKERRLVQVRCCLTSTETITTNRDGESRTSTFTRPLSSALLFNVALSLRSQRPY